jgi:hypothetical protein
MYPEKLEYYPIQSIETTLQTLSQLLEVYLERLQAAEQIYMKMNPPPDVDKLAHHTTNNVDTCYLATAANMLAGAGYGSGTTVQARADDIYSQLVNQFGAVVFGPGGWTDTALTWWLNSNHNIWPNNPYTIVTVFGNKIPRNPWNNNLGPCAIGNHLRLCHFVGLSISWPTTGASIGSGGHAITAWGDNRGEALLSNNPTRVRLVDSDRDTGGDVQMYTYDAFTNPNPGGPNEGNGWYLDYDPNHPYIKHIITLRPTDAVHDNKLTQKVVGSWEIHQLKKTAATDLHYLVGTDTDILNYKTTVDWSTQNVPNILEDQPRRKLKVEWDFSDNPVPYCTLVKITTEFILPLYNAIEYEDVYFTYPKDKVSIGGLKWRIDTPIIEKAEAIPNVTGGYVVGSFDVNTQTRSEPQKIVMKYRFIHEYSFNQSPEKHLLLLSAKRECTVSNLKIGHSYGYLEGKDLWEFDKWMTKSEKVYQLSEKPIELKIDWTGRLPYPEGENIKGRIPEAKSAFEYDVRPAKNMKEAMELIKAGYEYVTEIEGVMIFRKKR